jgi:hypothetical protein
MYRESGCCWLFPTFVIKRHLSSPNGLKVAAMDIFETAMETFQVVAKVKN